ncbi:MAG: hypothetical protein ACFFFG_18160, partial [Candidatus Thorarchaeota archaeon]
MDLILNFLPVITILAVGGGVWQIFYKFNKKKLRIAEHFNVFLLIGSFLLIVPLTWVGIQPNGVWTVTVGSQSLDLVNFSGWNLLYFFTGLIICLIGGYFALRRILGSFEEFHIDFAELINYRTVLIGFLILDYLFLSIVLPLRGFDTLYYYLPETEVFHQTNRITEANYLSFLPVVKSPMNVLIFVYGYYITNDLAIYLIPFLFFLGLVFLVYDFSLELFDNRLLAQTSVIFLLTLPLLYWFMDFWAFYQDLFLCYFVSVTCYFSYKWFKSPSNQINGIFVGMGLILSILTKITAWILPIILVCWLPSGSKGKVIRIGLILGLGLFTYLQVATRIYIGAILPIALAIIAVIYLIGIEQNPGTSTRGFLRQIPVFGGMLIGSFWILDRISLSDAVWEEISRTYFEVVHVIKWVYPSQPQDPLLHTLEVVHRINFFSAAGILFLGSAFVLPWIVLKFYSLRELKPITPLLIWILLFFIVWVTYYLTGSIRYLAPIIVPMVLWVAWGFHQLVKIVNHRISSDFLLILFASFGTFSFYYLIPLDSLTISDQTQESIGLAYNQAALSYYSHPEVLLILGLLLIVVFMGLTREYTVTRLKWPRYSVYFQRIRNGLLSAVLIVIILTPIAVQGYLLVYTNGNLREFHSIVEYEYRPEYQDLVKVIQQQNQPIAGIMTVRTPGFQFFVGQPTLDIYYQRSLFAGNPFFTLTNLTEIIDILQNPLDYIIETDFSFNISVSFNFIVVPSMANLYYEIYLSEI